MTRRRERGPFRDGRIHVCAVQCATCVGRPGNLMRLRPGKLAALVKENVDAEAALPCHSTLDGDRLVCRWFFDRHPTQPLQIAERLGMVTFVDPPVWP